MSKKSLLIFNLFLLILVSCESNPFPTEGQIVNSNEPIQRKVPPPYTVDVLATLKFKEGVNRSYPLKFYVPNGEAVYSFVGLPDGMEYNEADETISWEPGFKAANDINDPLVKSKRIPMEIWLRSSLDANTAIKKDIIIEVVDSPRTFEAESTRGTTRVTEGDRFENRITITNEDFPDGPFKVRYEDLPSTLKVIPRNNEINIDFTPDHYHVTVNDSCSFGSCEKEYENGKIIVTAPDGRELVIDQKIEVRDSRLDPVFTTPSVINQGLEVNFIVSAYDANAEIEPEVTLTKKPREGNVYLETVKSVKNNLLQTHRKLIWNNIPADRRGTSEEFRFRACTYDARKRMQNCVNKNVRVNIKENIYLAPIFNRSQWEIGHIEYLGNDKSREIEITVKDGNNPLRDLQSVEVYPEDMRKYVSYRNGEVRIQDDVAGLKQFKLKAKSIHDIETSEVFTYEVLPKDWSPNLVLVNSFRSNEIVTNRNIYKSLDVVNVDFQNLDKRLLSERETLIIATDSLKNANQVVEVSSLGSHFKNIIISTPLVDSIGGDLAKEISELGIAARGHFSSVTNGQLADYYFFIGRDVDLDYPRRRVFLSGALTSESSDPMLLNKKIDSECTEIFSIGDDATGLDHLISVKCQRQNGGYLIINGFEFGDLKFSPGDEELSEKWIKKLMENK